MARSSLLDGFAYGVLNEILGTFRTQDGGYAKPSRYEVIIAPPPGYSAKVKGGPINFMVYIAVSDHKYTAVFPTIPPMSLDPSVSL